MAVSPACFGHLTQCRSQGGMAVSPACFGHLTHALLALSAGRALAVLEGGYCRPALAAAAAHTLAALLGDPPPPLPPQLPPPSDRYGSGPERRR